MENLKWRIWVKPEGKYYFVNVDTLLYETFSKWEKEELDIQRFTGLLDKHGKEIYEGDIIKYEEKLFDIRFSPYHGWASALMDGESFEHWEIIGNIYEHGHLLENESKE